MREIVFEDGRRELIDDSKENRLYSGDTSNTYLYGKRLIKLFDKENEQFLKKGQVDFLKKLMSLNNPNVYKIYDFFKSDYNGKLLYNGYVMKKYNHYHNDVSPIGDNVFNILTVPIEQAINYYVGLYELIRRLTENHIFIDDLHRKNIIKTKNKLILIDADMYSNYSNGYAYENNYSQMRMCYGDLIASSLYLSYCIGNESNEKYNDYREIYLKYVKDLIDYEYFDKDKMFDILDKIKDYNNLLEYFDDNYSLVKRK